MSDEEGRLELTLTLHGFDTFNFDVDGEVFARKLMLFLRGIRASDKTVNGKRRHKLLLTALKKASASVSIREQVYTRGPVPSSGMGYFAAAVDAVYNKRPEARLLPFTVLKDIANLNHGAGHSFSFGEVKSNQGLLIRLDDYLGKVASSLITEIEIERVARPKRFSGIAYAYFDGVLSAVGTR
jgi:hypothetical protein